MFDGLTPDQKMQMLHEALTTLVVLALVWKLL